MNKCVSGRRTYPYAFRAGEDHHGPQEKVGEVRGRQKDRRRETGRGHGEPQDGDQGMNYSVCSRPRYG